MPAATPSECVKVSGVALATALLLVLTAGAACVVPLVRQVPSALALAPQLPPAKPDSAHNRLAQRRKLAAGPHWSELTLAEQKVLQPLQMRWPFMGEVQKRGWIVLASSFDSLSAQEQIKLRARMESWASLSAQQRSQARLNYAITNRLATKDKWAQWQAYQALSNEEKQALAAKAAAAKPAGAAPALRPVPAKKLVRVPTTSATAVANPPKVLPSTAQAAPQTLPGSVETRPVHMPSMVETAPVTLSTATPTALPSLEPAAAGLP